MPVVDIAADFRLKDPEAFEQWYGQPHPAPDLLEQSVYGLPELHKNQIAQAQVVANPGCYPTTALLALAPAYAEGLNKTLSHTREALVVRKAFADCQIASASPSSFPGWNALPRPAP